MSGIESTITWLDNIAGRIDAAIEVAEGGLAEDSLQSLKGRCSVIGEALNGAIDKICALQTDLREQEPETADV